MSGRQRVYKFDDSVEELDYYGVLNVPKNATIESI
jgi:hypothetical protein